MTINIKMLFMINKLSFKIFLIEIFYHKNRRKETIYTEKLKKIKTIEELFSFMQEKRKGIAFSHTQPFIYFCFGLMTIARFSPSPSDSV